MIRLFRYCLLFLCLPLVLTSCEEFLAVEVVGDGNLKDEQRSLSSFNQVVMESDEFDVILKSSNEQRVIVETDSNLLSYVTTEIEGNQLIVGVKPNFELQPREGIKIMIFFAGDNLTAEMNGGEMIADSLVLKNFDLSVFGMTKLLTLDTLRCDAVYLFSEGSTRIALNGIFNEFFLHQQGSGNISLSGYCNYADLLLEGSGKIDSREMVISEGDIRLYGSGLVLCQVTRRLNAKIDGSGRIYYYGMPDNLEKDVEGEGLVLPGE